MNLQITKLACIQQLARIFDAGSGMIRKCHSRTFLPPFSKLLIA
jgi:hypothetical protein